MNPVDRIRFETLGLEEGMSQSAVLCMLQDSYGFMWFGTQDGLNRYDGRKFTVYKSSKLNRTSISSNLIFSLYEDPKGNLWAGTLSGLNRYDRDSDSFERFTSERYGNSFPVDQVRSIVQMNERELCVATYGAGIAILDTEKKKFRSIGIDAGNMKGLRYQKVNYLFVDSSGSLYAGTWGGGVDLFDQEKECFSPIRFEKDLDSSVSHKRINHIAEDKDGVILISANGGLFNLAKSESVAKQVILPEIIRAQESELISCAMSDNAGNLWIGTREMGLWLKRPGSNSYVNYVHDDVLHDSISNNSVFCLYQDRLGLMWAGTYGDGVNRFSPERNNVLHFFHDPNDETSVNANKVYCFLETNAGEIWLGTRGKGISILDPITNEIRPFVHSSLDQKTTGQEIVMALEEDENGVIWAGTSGGGLIGIDAGKDLLEYHRHNAEDPNSLSDDTVYTLKADGNGKLWIGTSGGLNVLDLSTRKFSAFRHDADDVNTLSSDRVRCICFGRDDLLWIATEYGGLCSLDISSGKISRISGYNGITLDSSLYYVACDSAGNVWAGSPSGIYVIDNKTKGCINITENEGLPNYLINAIVRDDAGYMWVSTNNGIVKLDESGKVLETFDKSDGFQGNEFIQYSALKLRDGRILFGGINGFNLFDPGGFGRRSDSPSLCFTEFRLFNKPVMPGEDSLLKQAIWNVKEIELSYKESVFSLSFSAMDFRSPQKIQYKYRMNGFDKDWIPAGNAGTATYTNLDPGEYIFRVRSTNSDGMWGEKDLSLTLRIKPPFWKTGWFKALSAITLATAGSIVYQSKLSQMRKEKQAQEEFTKKLIEAQENERKRIASELHDSIGHGLLISKNKLLMSLNEDGLDDTSSAHIKEVSEIISGTLGEVREISYNLHPYQIERLGITKAIRSIVDRVKGSVDISFVCSVDEIDSVLHQDAEITLYRIIQECINNIIKHSEATEALLNVSRNDSELSVLISDNGRGMNISAHDGKAGSRGLGLKGMSERARIINAELNIVSSPNEGTEVKLNIPLSTSFSNPEE